MEHSALELGPDIKRTHENVTERSVQLTPIRLWYQGRNREVNSRNEETIANNREMRVKMQEVLIFQVVAPTVPLFLVPTSKYRRREWGTGIGSRHSHSSPRRA